MLVKQCCVVRDRRTTPGPMQDPVLKKLSGMSHTHTYTHSQTYEPSHTLMNIYHTHVSYTHIPHSHKYIQKNK